MHLFAALATSIAYSALSAWYLHAVVGKQNAGLSRIVLYLPVVLVNGFIPFLYSAEGVFLYARCGFAYTHAWLASLKGIAFCLNRGPLIEENEKEEDCWSFAQFTALYYLSVFPAKDQLKGVARVKESARLLSHTILKTGTMLASYMMLTPDSNNLMYIDSILFGVSLYLFLGSLMNLSSLIAIAFFGITTVDNFNYPFVATSLHDFWRFRWNVTTGKIFRSLSYDIILENSLVRRHAQYSKKPGRASELRRIVGVFAVFVLSGLTHAAYFWIAFGWVSIIWFLYFILQALLLLFEGLVQKWSSAHLGISDIPPLISIPLIFHVNLLFARFFFFSEIAKTSSLEAAFQMRGLVLGTTEVGGVLR